MNVIRKSEALLMCPFIATELEGYPYPDVYGHRLILLACEWHSMETYTMNSLVSGFFYSMWYLWGLSMFVGTTTPSQYWMVSHYVNTPQSMYFFHFAGYWAASVWGYYKECFYKHSMDMCSSELMCAFLKKVLRGGTARGHSFSYIQLQIA